MKLRSKLFYSYLFLIVLFSFSLFWLVVEIRGMTLSLRQHAYQDVRGIISVSRQMQVLEDLNADYMRLFLPGRARYTRIAQAERSRGDFHAKWTALKERLNDKPEVGWLDAAVSKIAYSIFEMVDDIDQKEFGERITTVAGAVDREWEKCNRAIRKTVAYLRKGDLAQARRWRDKRFTQSMKELRIQLTELNKILGKKGDSKALQLANIARKTQWVILWTEVIIVLLTLFAAYLAARKLTKPIPELKDAMDKIAIQDFDIHIKHKTDDELGELSIAFEQLSERLREANSYKTSMLSQFTHEMKSPLGSIKQAVSLLEDTIPEMDKRQKRFFTIIKNNYETLFKLINNILHSSTYNPENIKLKYAKLNLRKLIEDVLVDLAPLFKAKKMKVDIIKESDTISGEFDQDRLREVFHNLFSNAIKFSLEGTTLTVTMNVKVPIVEIIIKDQGIGIPAREIPYIFEKMYRASNSKKISVKGTGLGLYITSQIIRAHGGRIKVKSEEGKGTKFKIIIPRNRNIAQEGGWLEAR